MKGILKKKNVVRYHLFETRLTDGNWRTNLIPIGHPTSTNFPSS